MHFNSAFSSFWHTLRRNYLLSQLKTPAFAYLYNRPMADEWVALDCETTGLDVKKDHIISIAAVRFDPKRIHTSERLELIVKPPISMDANSIRIHQLRSVDVEQGIELEQAMQTLLQFIGNRALVGYYTKFDVGMISRAAKNLLGTALPNAYFDVGDMYHQYKYRQLPANEQYEGRPINLCFDHIMTELSLPERPAHNALNDAVMAALAFIKLRHLLRK